MASLVERMFLAARPKVLGYDLIDSNHSVTTGGPAVQVNKADGFAWHLYY